EGPAHTTARYGEVPLVHATAVLDDATGAVAVFAVNRSLRDALPLRIALRGLTPSRVVEHSVLTDADPDARNTLAEPERVQPVWVGGTTLADGTVHAELPPLSWNMIRLA